MCWEFLDRLGPESTKPKHLKDKKNQKKEAPNPWKSFCFLFAFQMLRLSGLEAQELQLAYWAGGDNRRRKNKW